MPQPDEPYAETVARLVSQATGHRERLTTLEQRADAMDQRIERLTEDMIKALTTRKGPAVIAWHELEPNQYTAHLADLAAWMEAFLAAYPSAAASVRPCWKDHKDAVTELGLIWCESTRIYAADRPSLDEALVFHDRWLPGVLKRVQQITANCATGCVLTRPVWTELVNKEDRMAQYRRVAESAYGPHQTARRSYPR
jgi:hypothetical protein